MPRLFLADNNLTTQKVFRVALESEGFQVRSFETGQDLLAALSEESAEVLALNVLLPDFDGYDLCRAVTTDSRTAGIPVILLVGAFQEFDEVRAREAGCHRHLLKPFETAELAELVNQVLTEPVRRRPVSSGVEKPAGSGVTVFEIPVEPASAETAFTLSAQQYRPRPIKLESEAVKPASPPPAPEPAETISASQPEPAEERVEQVPAESAFQSRLHPEDIDLIVEKLLDRLPAEILQLIRKLGSPPR
jgi:DNA-binding response OmpR family regulator